MTFIENAKAKIKEVGSKAKEKAVETKQKIEKFVDEDAGMVMMLLPMASSVLLAIAGNAAASKKERYDRCLVEDDRTGEDLMVKHPLTNDEIMDLSDRMHAFDQSKGEALRDMGLLKKERSRK